MSALAVLIVDDEKWVREVFKDFCRTTAAFDVDLAEGGTDAVRKVESTVQEKFSGMASGMSLPPGMKLPF